MRGQDSNLHSLVYETSELSVLYLAINLVDKERVELSIFDYQSNGIPFTYVSMIGRFREN